MSLGVGEGRGPHNGQTWRGTERETNTDLATDKKTLEDLEIAEKKRDRDKLGCSWRQNYGDTDTETWKKHRDKETHSLIFQQISYSTYYVLGTVLGARDIAVNKRVKSLPLEH